VANITEEHLHHMARRHHAVMQKFDGLRANQDGKRVYIDGKLVGVEVDTDGNPLGTPLPNARVVRLSWWSRLRGRSNP
jgi:hypothetical protein